MSIEHQPSADRPSKKALFLYIDPVEFVNDEQRDWLASSSVAHIAPLWLPLKRDGRNYGGAEDVVVNNIQALENFGINYQFIFGHPDNINLAQELRAQVFTPSHVGSGANLLGILRTDQSYAMELEKMYIREAYEQVFDIQKRVSIVHDHTVSGRDTGLWVSRFLKPVVRTEHGPLIQPYATRLEEIVLNQFTNKKGLGFVAISQDQREQLPDLNWLGVNYNGVDLNDFEYRQEKDDYLLFMGRVSSIKGPHNAIRLAQRLNKRLIIAGAVEETPESLKYFQEEVEPFIDGKTIIHRSQGVNTNERRELLTRAACLVMLIEWPEPFGMVMAESLASGTPVIGYRRGSIPEVVQGDTGFIATDFEDAVEKTQLLLDGKFSPQECRKRAEQYFSAQAMAARYVDLYMKAQQEFAANFL